MVAESWKDERQATTPVRHWLERRQQLAQAHEPQVRRLLPARLSLALSLIEYHC